MEYDELRDTYFSSVPESMWTLMSHGTFLDSVAQVLSDIRKKGNTFLTTAFLIYIMLSHFTVLNMLIGIICDVMNTVQLEESHRKDLAELKHELGDLLECYDKNRDGTICRAEFMLLMDNPEAIQMLDRFGTNRDGLMILLDVLYENSEYEHGISFEELLNVIIRLKDSRNAHVTDVVELRQQMKGYHDELLKRLPQPSSASPMVMVKLDYGDSTVEDVMHLSSTSVGEVVLQCQKYAKERSLTAFTKAGVRVGEEVRLIDLAPKTDGPIELKLVQKPDLSTTFAPRLSLSLNAHAQTLNPHAQTLR